MENKGVTRSYYTFTKYAPSKHFYTIGRREIRNIDSNKQEIFIGAGIFIAVFEDNYVQ